MKILLVDDDPDESVIFRDAVEQMGEDIQITQVYYCHEVPGELTNRNYDLVILDVNLPLVSGIECLKKIRAEEMWKDLPIVMFSNVINQLNIDRCYQQNAQYFFIKPNSIDDIIVVIRKLLQTDFKSTKQVDKESFLIQY